MNCKVPSIGSTTAEDKSSRPASSASPRSINTTERCPPSNQQDLQILRPVTFRVMADPSPDNLNHLINVVNKFPDKVEQYVSDYVIFPLAQHLKLNRKHPEDIRIALHDCATAVLKKWQVESFPVFAEIYQYCIISICKIDDLGNFDKTLSEAFAERAVGTIKALVERSLAKHYKKLYSEKYIAAVGQCICILLQIANMETTKSLRIMAIHTVVLLLEICEGDEEACHRVFKFLPGMATTFVKCCISQGGRYQKDVIKESLKGLETALLVCISYEKVDDLSAVDENLTLGIVEITEALMFHPEKRLRVSLAHFTQAILEDIPTPKLPKCSKLLWSNALVFASGDDDKESSTRCLNLIKLPKNYKIIKEMCSFEEIEHHLKKAVVLSNIGELTKCCQSAYRVASSLVVTKLSLKEFRSLLPRIIDLRTTVVRRQVKLESKQASLEDCRIVKSCLCMCEVIFNTYNKVVGITEFLSHIEHLNTANDSDLLRSGGGIHLLNEIFEVLATKKSRDLNYQFVEVIVDKYLAFLRPLPSVSYQIRSNHNSPSTSKSTTSRIEYTSAEPRFGAFVHTCCILAGLTVLTKLEPCTLSTVIFPLIEYAGLREPDYAHIAEVAEECIQKIAETSGPVCDVKEFLAMNLDLIMSEFGARTEMIADNPQMANALVYLAKYFDFSQSHFLSFIEQIIQLASARNLEVRFQEMFTNIYYAYTVSMWTHYYEDAEKKGNVSQTAEEKNKSKKPSLLQRLLDYQEALGIVVTTDEEESVNNLSEKLRDADLEEGKEDNLSSDIVPEMKALRPEISLTLKIANKTVPYLTNSTAGVKITAMDVLIKSIQLLAEHEDELLPLLHSCWISMTSRFHEKEIIVLRKSFELLLTMVNSSGTFLRKRTIDGVFPILAEFLKELAELSRSIEDKNSIYFTYTQGYKLQHTILAGLATICEAMEIGERELDKIFDACLIYLDPDQHKNLREAAIKLMVTLGHGHCGSSVWMKLLANQIVQLPPEQGQPFKPLSENFMNNGSKKKIMKKRKGK